MWEMFANYEIRRIGRYENGHTLVSTVAVTDSEEPYETAIRTKDYDVTVVEMYADLEQAKEGHEAWVELAKADKLPISKPEDRGTNLASMLLRLMKASEEE